MKETFIDVLIPTYNRSSALAMTLTSLYFQEYKHFKIYISDQSDSPVENAQEIQTIIRAFELRGQEVELHRNLPNRGMSQQRQFLLEKAANKYVLFLDDDLIMESFMVGKLIQAIETERCGLVGTGTIGLNYLHDERLHEQMIEFWEDKVLPETIYPSSQQWRRHVLHNAANLYHLQRRLSITSQATKRYKLAWASACVLYDREKLLKSGGFNFGDDVPQDHCGEDVAAQLRVMAEFGGCGILPSGVYHQDLETTLPNRKFNIPERVDLFGGLKVNCYPN